MLFTNGSRHSGSPRASTDPLARRRVAPRGAREGPVTRRSELRNLALGTRLLTGPRRLAQRPVGAEISHQARRKGRRCRRQQRGRFRLWPSRLFTTRSPPVPGRGCVNFVGLSQSKGRAFTSRSLAFTTGSPAVTTGSPPWTGRPPAFTTGSALGRFSPAEGLQTGSRHPKRGQVRPRFAEPQTGRLRAPQEKRGVVSPRPKRRSVHRLRPKFVRGQLWLPTYSSART